MGYSFSGIDTEDNDLFNPREKIFDSHKQKIEKMNDEWGESPYSNYEVAEKDNSYYLKRISKALPVTTSRRRGPTRHASGCCVLVAAANQAENVQHMVCERREVGKVTRKLETTTCYVIHTT